MNLSLRAPCSINHGFSSLSVGIYAAACLTGFLHPSALAQGPNCDPPPDGIVSWWRAEDNALDQLGAQDGTTPFGIAYADGVVGRAFDFDGSTRRINVPDSPAFKLTNAMTLEAWVYPRAYQGFITFRGDNRGGLDTWTLDAYQPGLVNFQIDDAANNYANVQAPLQLNQWQHVAATWDRTSGDMKIYVNAALAAQTNTTLIPIADLDAEGAVGIGNHGGTFHQFPFDGLIDELSIYSRALGSNEIAVIYLAGSAGKCVTNLPPGTAPAIVSQPQDQTVPAGSTAVFSVTATGTAPLSYQWEKDERTLLNATNAGLILSNITSNDAGDYRVIITNLYGGTKSLPATLTVTPAPECVPAPEGVVAWWPGESNAWDVVGGFDGIFYQGPPAYILYAPGLVASAFKFSTGWSMTAPVAPGLDLGREDGFSFDAWINPDSVSSTFGLFGWGGSVPGFPSTPPGVSLRIVSPGILQAWLMKTNNQLTLLQSAPNTVQARLWQHVALSCNTTNGEMVIYLDGQPVVQNNIGPVALQTSGFFSLGYAAGPRFSGLMDEPTLYNRALTANEIQSIVTADEAGKCPPPTPPCVTPPAEIVAWWRGESNTVDSVAGNQGILVPANFPLLAAYQAGVRDAAFSFKGPNFVSVPRSDVLDVGKAAGLTIEAWINPSQFRPMPIVEWTDTNNFGASLWTSYYRGPSVLEANLIDTAGGFHLLQSPINTLTYNTWQHVALTYDKMSGQAVLYVNGNSVASTNAGSFTPRTDTDLLLGFHPRYTGQGGYGAPPYPQIPFTGSMDEVALYRRALKAVEIRALSQSHPGKCLDLPPMIGRQPVDQIALQGGAVTFDVGVGGAEPLAYQWFFGNTVVRGANGPTLSRSRLQPADAGYYSLVVSNMFGSAASRLASLTVLPEGQCLPTPEGAVAFWRGDSNEVDEVGGHDAQWGNNTPQAFASGLVGEAFRFMGQSYLQVPATPDLDVAASGGFTVEGWIKPDFALQQQAIVDWNDGLGNVGVGLMLSGPGGPGSLQVTLTDTKALSSVERIVTFATPWWTIGSQTNPVPDWTHVALTFDTASGRASVFVNGQSVANRVIAPIRTRTSRNDYASFSPTTSGDLYLGWRRSGIYAGPRFRGAMDEMAVYNRALTPLELEAIYVVGSNGKCQPRACVPPAEGIVGWWRGESNAVDSVLGNGGLFYPRIKEGFTNGRVGTAFVTGTRQYVDVRSPAGLDVGAGPGLSIEAWVNPGQTGSGTILSWALPSGVSLEYGSVGQGSVRANLRDNNGLSHFVNSVSDVVRTGQWQHVALTYDHASGWAALYVNGLVVTSTNIGVFTPETRGSITIGAGPAGYFYGAVDEVAVYGRALTPFEISDIYRSANGRCTDPPVVVQQPQSLRVNAGSDVTFNVEATGNPLLRYQWQRGHLGNDQVVRDATNNVLTLFNVQAENEGIYWVLVTNAFGSAVSSNALLQVNYPPVADASATPTPLILPACTNQVATVLDGSQSSDPDTDPLTYLWISNLESQTPAVLATGVVAVVALPAGTHAFDLVADDSLLSSTNRIVVEVLTPAMALQYFIDTVKSSGWDKQQSLLASLNAAAGSVGKNNLIPAVNQLEAFQNKVKAQVTPVDAALAVTFTDGAQAIIDALLNCGTHPGKNHGHLKAKHSNGKPRLEFEGTVGAVYIIKASSDMVSWEMIGVAKHKGNGQFDFEDANADKLPCRFYRVVTP